MIFTVEDPVSPPFVPQCISFVIILLDDTELEGDQHFSVIITMLRNFLCYDPP